MYNRVEDKLRKDKKLFVYSYLEEYDEENEEYTLTTCPVDAVDLKDTTIFFSDVELDIDETNSRQLKITNILDGSLVDFENMLDMAKRWRLLPEWCYDAIKGKFQLPDEGILEFNKVED
ncbi:hypothetical protein AGENTSMITH_96 [Bacillus phage vB_BspM_AgentSmith]|nr:hypothetical protein AGENTSMITH_96 [Bacillus phage vB_BspM_AgentSmith]